MFNSRTFNKSETGKLGEEIACKYLIGKGYKILERNYRKPWGELDIVAMAKNNILVLVEVKALKDNPSGTLSPEDNLTSAKLLKLQRTCRQFVAENPDSVLDDMGWRIDLVAVKMPSTGESDAKKCEIMHYENI